MQMCFKLYKCVKNRSTQNNICFTNENEDTHQEAAWVSLMSQNFSLNGLVKPPYNQAMVYHHLLHHLNHHLQYLQPI